jgi:drug/metabolite transporter (DMT)-like permease
VSDDSTGITGTPPQQALAMATTLSLAAVAACAVGRLMWPSRLTGIVDFGTLLGAGVLGYLLGSWILFRAMRRAKARWIVLLVVYDVVMPLAIFGLVILVQLAARGAERALD